MKKKVLFLFFVCAITNSFFTIAMEKMNKTDSQQTQLYQLLKATYILDVITVNKIFQSTQYPTIVNQKFYFFNISPYQLAEMPRYDLSDTLNKKQKEIKKAFSTFLNKCDTEIQEKALKNTALIPPLCAIATFFKDYSTLKIELKKSFPTNFAQNYYHNPLYHIAIQNDDAIALKILINESRLNALIHVKLNNPLYAIRHNTTPLDYAISRCNYNVIEILAQHPCLQKKALRLEKKLNNNINLNSVYTNKCPTLQPL